MSENMWEAYQAVLSIWSWLRQSFFKIVPHLPELQTWSRTPLENLSLWLVSLQTCSLTIMDDIQNPSIEGSESFVVFLSSPQGAVLQEPYEANVVITDTFQDSMCKSQTLKQPLKTQYAFFFSFFSPIDLLHC